MCKIIQTQAKLGENLARFANGKIKNRDDKPITGA